MSPKTCKIRSKIEFLAYPRGVDTFGMDEARHSTFGNWQRAQINCDV